MNSETSREERTLLTRRAFTLLDEWSIPAHFHPRLLGLDPAMRKRFVNRYRLGMPLPTEGDSYARIDLLLRIENALQKLFPHSRMSANLWVTTPNPRYGGDTPLDTMLSGGLEGLERVEGSLTCRNGW